MFKRKLALVSIALAGVVLFATQSGLLFADTPGTPWETGARAADDAYWAAYNRSDADAMNAWLGKDVEFYHDRGGKLIGKKALAAVNDGMRTNPNSLRREAVPGSVRFYPMREGDTVYGAIVTGVHRFYVRQAGQPDEFVGHANFTHLMLLEGKEWRIARIFSFEHTDAPEAGEQGAG